MYFIKLKLILNNIITTNKFSFIKNNSVFNGKVSFRFNQLRDQTLDFWPKCKLLVLSRGNIPKYRIYSECMNV